MLGESCALGKTKRKSTTNKQSLPTDVTAAIHGMFWLKQNICVAFMNSIFHDMKRFEITVRWTISFDSSKNYSLEHFTKNDKH
jgi:hypothetical protein